MADASLPAWSSDELDRALQMLADMVNDPGFAGPFDAVHTEFFGKIFDAATKPEIDSMLRHEHTQAIFTHYLFFDAYITADKHRLTEILIGDDIRRHFTVGALRYLERMAASTLRPYEVREVMLDRGFVLRDLWSGTDVHVSERNATRFLQRDGTFFARLIEGPRGAIEIFGAVLEFMPLAMEELLQKLRASLRAKRRKRPSLDETTFLKEAAPQIVQGWLARFLGTMPSMQTTDGEALRPADLIYDVLDADALRAALLGRDDFYWDDSAKQYIWLGEPSAAFGGEKVHWGSLTPVGKRMRAFVMSDERAARLRALLDRIAGDSLRYRLTEIHNLAAGVSEASRRTAKPQAVSDEEAEILDRVFQTYYRQWLDDEIPALNGRTPRHAARLKTQRRKVAAMVREIEVLQRDSQARGCDVSWLWEELNILDLR